MAWLDDRIRDHPKMGGITPLAFQQWIIALCYCSAHGTRGHLDAAIEIMRIPRRVVDELVRRGLWEQGDDGYWVHDWNAHNGKRDVKQADAKRSFDTRRQQLMRNPELRAAVRERDGDECRYCGREVNWHDRKGIAGATYDHVDPEGPNDIGNLVVCCRSCNSVKAGRTPQEAGLRLNSVPTKPNSDLDTDLDRDLDMDLTLSSPARERPRAGAGANDHDHDHDQVSTSSFAPKDATHDDEAIKDKLEAAGWSEGRIAIVANRGHLDLAARWLEYAEQDATIENPGAYAYAMTDGGTEPPVNRERQSTLARGATGTRSTSPPLPDRAPVDEPEPAPPPDAFRKLAGRSSEPAAPPPPEIELPPDTETRGG